MNFQAMIQRLNDADVKVSMYRFTEQYFRPDTWHVDLEKHSDEGEGIKVEKKGMDFFETFERAFNAFFKIAESGVTFVTALPPPSVEHMQDNSNVVDLDEETPF